MFLSDRITKGAGLIPDVHPLHPHALAGVGVDGEEDALQLAGTLRLLKPPRYFLLELRIRTRGDVGAERCDAVSFVKASDCPSVLPLSGVSSVNLAERGARRRLARLVVERLEREGVRGVLALDDDDMFDIARL